MTMIPFTTGVVVVVRQTPAANPVDPDSETAYNASVPWEVVDIGLPMIINSGADVAGSLSNKITTRYRFQAAVPADGHPLLYQDQVVNEFNTFVVEWAVIRRSPLMVFMEGSMFIAGEQ